MYIIRSKLNPRIIRFQKCTISHIYIYISYMYHIEYKSIKRAFLFFNLLSHESTIFFHGENRFRISIMQMQNLDDRIVMLVFSGFASFTAVKFLTASIPRTQPPLVDLFWLIRRSVEKTTTKLKSRNFRPN